MKKLFAILTLSSSLLLAEGFTLKSETVSGQFGKKQEFNGFGCSGENISPDLSWENAPKGTKSFALTVYDPDAPTGSGFWHWVVFNIPKSVSKLEEGFGNKPHKDIIQSLNNYGTNSFGGACPPVGDKAHRYEFTIHALDVDKLELDEKTNPAVVGFYLNSHTIEKSTLTAYYKR
ncbi:YbhB/YbcL family Raf kinase inhibitor-like protein [Halarcobacter sp.]|uniref:YbhB/YbcL family Raf kinase inhibitor-like protein n=1 Tax=Halarcobacter sp. TaxID=2321133 RepID=UPI0029F4AC7D|nr:YbhB/YbcL family Raf kinase inhibitor-like protein [Halarcobacter sp.]